jgi:hypothetical protein
MNCNSEIQTKDEKINENKRKKLLDAIKHSIIKNKLKMTRNCVTI